MKKSLLALAVMTASGLACAQSSVTMFGVVDLGVNYLKTTGQGSTTALESDGNDDSRLGFRGVEDLGNGLKVGFWLEGAIGADTGSGFDFGRRSTLSLMGNWGEIRMGRDKLLTDDSIGDFDLFNTLGAGLYSTLVDDNRVSNSITYHLPSGLMGSGDDGLYGALQYEFGEVQGSSSANSSWSARLGFRYGPADINAGYSKLNDERSSMPVGDQGDVTIYNIAGSYDFGIFKPALGFGEEKNNNTFRSKIQYVMIGLSAPVGEMGEFKAAYNYGKDKSSQFAPGVWGGNGEKVNRYALGYTHGLSLRTSVYTNLEYTDWDAFPSDKGIQVGVTHVF